MESLIRRSLLKTSTLALAAGKLCGYPGETSVLLRRAIGSRKCAGLELTIYDPERSPTGRCAKLIVDILSDAVKQSGFNV